MERRQFLKTAAAATVLLHQDPALWGKKAESFGRQRLKVGILSDVHVKYFQPSVTTGRFVKALNYFKENRVDAVLIAGDMTSCGNVKELRMIADAWYSVFKDDKGLDGQPVTKLFIYGNHEIDGWKYSVVKQRPDYASILSDRIDEKRGAVWEELFHEPWSPIYIKDVKGYKFIGGHFANSLNMPGLEEFLEAHKAELPPVGKPFFYFQHTHPRGTCSAPWTWGQDDGTVTEILSRYPNVVAFSGHSHSPLTDDRTVWQGSFTSIGTASLSFIIGFGGRENGRVYGSPNQAPSQMPYLNGSKAHHGQIMTVYDDYLVFRKHEFEYDEDLGDDWVVPLDVSLGAMSFEKRAEAEVPPQFRPASAVTTEVHPGKDRQGVEQEQMAVRFPSAPRTKSSPRAFDYEVCVEVEDVDTYKTVLTKRVYSEAYYLGEQRDAATEVVCEFGLGELPQGRPFRFAVRPCGCFGRKGEVIYSPVIVNA